MQLAGNKFPFKQVRQATSIDDWHQTVLQLAKLDPQQPVVIIYPDESWLEKEADFIAKSLESVALVQLKTQMTPHLKRGVLQHFKMGEYQFLLTTAQQWLGLDVIQALQNDTAPFILLVSQADLALTHKTKKPVNQQYFKLATLSWMHTTSHITPILRTQAPVNEKIENQLKKLYGLEKPVDIPLLETQIKMEAHLCFSVYRLISAYQKWQFLKQHLKTKQHRFIVFIEDEKRELPRLEKLLASLTAEELLARVELLPASQLAQKLPSLLQTTEDLNFVFWQLPSSFMLMLQPQWWLPKQRALNCTVLYTKEDYFSVLSRLKWQFTDNNVLKQMMVCLNQVRQFCNQPYQCREQTLLEIETQSQPISTTACGRCDFCTHPVHKTVFNFLDGFLF